MFGNNIFPINPPRVFPPTKEKSRKISKIQRLIQLTIFTRFSLTNYLPSKIAEKFILNKHRAEMSLQFSVDELIQPLVSLSYLSSEEEMEVDCPSTGTEQDQDQDSDIEVIACFRETSMPIPKKVGGRGMTLDLSSCADNDSLSNTLCSEASYFNSGAKQRFNRPGVRVTPSDRRTDWHRRTSYGDLQSIGTSAGFSTIAPAPRERTSHRPSTTTMGS